MLDLTRTMTERAARDHYERMSFVPDSVIMLYGDRMFRQKTWTQLPEIDREHYRNLVRPIVQFVLDTLEAERYTV